MNDMKESTRMHQTPMPALAVVRCVVADDVGAAVILDGGVHLRVRPKPLNAKKVGRMPNPLFLLSANCTV